MKYKVGDIVRTITDVDDFGVEAFPAGTIGKITEVSEIQTPPYRVEALRDYWWYSEDMLELVETEKTYEQGLNDAWELIKKTEEMSDDDYYTCFGESVYDGITALTPQEALAKLKAYEERIEVGDVVVHGGDTVFVVTKIDKLIMGYDKIGDIHSFCFPNQFIKKTGKHIDITSILEQIREV